MKIVIHSTTKPVGNELDKEIYEKLLKLSNGQLPKEYKYEFIKREIKKDDENNE